MESVREPTDNDYWAKQHRREAEAEKDADRVLQLERCIQEMVDYPDHMLAAVDTITDPTSKNTYMQACAGALKGLQDIANMYNVAVQ